MKRTSRLAAALMPALLVAANGCAHNVDPPNVSGDTADQAQPAQPSANSAINSFPKPPVPTINPATQLVAHAGGDTFDGQKYTNSIDAFINSYNEGMRVFEFDFIRLVDGTVIAAHDGLEEQVYGLPPNRFRSATLEEVQNLRFNGKYSVMFAQDIISLLREYPDITIIADSKWDLAETYQAFFHIANAENGDISVLDRLIPHVGTQEELDVMRATNPRVQPMLAVYRTQYMQTAMTDPQILDFVDRNQISSVMMWEGQYDPTLTLGENSERKQRFSPELVRDLQNRGVTCYVHTLNDVDRARWFMGQGVHVYTDHLGPHLFIEDTSTSQQISNVNRPAVRPEMTISSLLQRPDLATQTQAAAGRAVNRAFGRSTPGR